MAQGYELMGETALRALVQGLQNAPAAGGADTVLVLDGGKIRAMGLDAFADLLGLALPFTFKYNYTGSNSPQIYHGTSDSAYATIFCCDGDFYVEVNGVEVQSGSATLALGDYMTTGENEVKVYPLSGAKMYRAISDYDLEKYAQYITEVVSWGNCEWGAVDYLLSNATALKSIPLFGSGFAGVTNFSSCFEGCSGLTSLPEGLFNNCPNVTTFRYCFSSCSGLTSLPEGLFNNCPNVTTFQNCFNSCSGLTLLPEGLFNNCPNVTTFQNCFRSCTGLTGESAFDRVDIDGVSTVIHLYERENYPDLYTAPIEVTTCYLDCTNLDDYDAIPDEWK